MASQDSKPHLPGLTCRGSSEIASGDYNPNTMKSNSDSAENCTDSKPDTKVTSPNPAENRPNPSPNNTKATRLSADYTLPHAVKARVDGNYYSANAIAIVGTLFAGVMIGMGQVINSETDTSNAWEAVRVLTYGSVISNLTSAMCALYVMVMCADIPQQAHTLAATDPDSWPAKFVAKQELDLNLIENEYDLLREFGMPATYARMEYWQLTWLIVGLVSMFLAITVWSWAAQTRVVAALLLLFVLPALFCALYPIWVLPRDGLRERRAARLAASQSPPMP